MAAANYPNVGTKVSEFNQGWVSIFNTRLDPGYIAEIQKYGVGSLVFDGLELAGRTINLGVRTPKWFEKLEWEKSVKINADVAAGAAGATFDFVVSTDDRDAQGNVPIQVGDGIVVPSAYQTPGEDRIYVITTYVAGTYTATCTPINSTGTTYTASQIGTLIPADTTLKIQSNYSGYGTGQPTGSIISRAEMYNTMQIMKTSLDVEGGLGAIKWRPVKMADGTPGLWIEGQENLEYEHNKKIDDAILLGELNDNTSLTATSQFGGTNVIPSTEGVWNSILNYGQIKYFASTWSQTDYYDIKDLALSQMVMNREFTDYCGTDLLRMKEEGNLEFIREYSGGSDLFKSSDRVGIDVKYVHLNGCIFRIQELKSWSNPQRWGNKAYEFSKRGFMVPEEMGAATIEGKKEQVPNIMLAYLNNNGEDRSRVMRHVPGMSGRYPQAYNQYDGDHVYILTEACPLVFRANQLIAQIPA
jgi:hypothetical protein